MKRQKLTRGKKDKAGMLKPSGESKYGRKRSYLASQQGDDKVFGFQVPQPKPWR